PGAAPSSPTSPEPPAGESSQRTIGLVVGGAGVVGLVVGSVLGLVAKSSYDHALQTECGNNPNGGCSQQGIADGKSAHGQAAASTVAFVAGGALLATGAVLYFTAPKARVTVGATMATQRTGLVVSGVW
ncbi:MAG: tetratricopeptide repeat protein, partial [Polyangiaceae bacterium]